MASKVFNISGGGGGSSGGGGIALGGVTNIKTIIASGAVYFKWTDPDDIVVAGATLATWKGTLLVRKVGSYPVNRRDGEVVGDFTTRDSHKDTYFGDSGLTNGQTYFYKFFPYTTTGTYTDDAASQLEATPGSIPVGAPTGLSAVSSGNGKAEIKWTDPAETVTEDGIVKARWGKAVVILKAGSKPTGPDDAGDFRQEVTTRNAHTTTPLVATGLTNGTTYNVAVYALTTEGTPSGPVETTVVPNRIVVATVPSQSNTLTYTGQALTPQFANYDQTKMTISFTAQTNAGDYEATVTLMDDFCWTGGDTAPKTIPWKIGRKTVSVPTTSSSFTYDGNTKTPSFNGYDANAMTMGGETSGINAKTYTTTFTVNSNHQWPDGNTGSKSVTWPINKANGSLTLSNATVTLNTSKRSDTVTASRTGDGVISISNSAPSIVTASLNAATGVITLTSVNDTTGTAEITVNVAAGTNWNAPASQKITVKAEFLPAVGTALDAMSWADIKRIADSDLGETYFKVGDRKAITLNGNVGTKNYTNVTLYTYILGFNHNASLEGQHLIHFGGFKTAATDGVDVALDATDYNSSPTSGTISFNMNHWWNTTYYGSNFGGWKGCDMRYDILGSTNVQPSEYGKIKTTANVGYDPNNYNPATAPVQNTLMAALPADLRAVIQPITKYTDNVGNSSNAAGNVTATIDYLPLLAEFEVHNARTYANENEKSKQAQYAYYAASNSKIKYRQSATGTALYYWNRSPYYSNANYFCRVYTDGNATGTGAYGSTGVSPLFAV